VRIIRDVIEERWPWASGEDESGRRALGAMADPASPDSVSTLAPSADRPTFLSNASTADASRDCRSWMSLSVAATVDASTFSSMLVTAVGNNQTDRSEVRSQNTARAALFLASRCECWEPASKIGVVRRGDGNRN
jgi:hypothetical protein